MDSHHNTCIKMIQAWLAAFCRSRQTLTSLLPTLQQERLPVGYDSIPFLKTAFVIFKNWNLRKSANYFNFIKRWKVACVAGGFVCERTNERQRFLSRFRSRRQQNRQLQGYWKANDNTESKRRANSNINSLQVFLVAFLPSSKFVAMMISIHDHHHYYLSYFWSRDDQMELLYIIFFLSLPFKVVCVRRNWWCDIRKAFCSWRKNKDF